MDRDRAINARMAKVRATKRRHQPTCKHLAGHTSHWISGLWVCLLRDQGMACLDCGKLVGAGDVVLMPRATAKGLVRIGDAVIVQETK